MVEPSKLDDILELENAPILAGLRCPDTDIAAWPAVRNEVIRKILGDLLYPTAPLVDPHRRPSYFQAARSGLHASRWNQLHPPRESEVLIVATGSGLRPNEGLLFNSYTDPFAVELAGRAWTYESVFENRWRGRRSNDRLTFALPDRIWVGIRSLSPVQKRHLEVAHSIREIVAERARTVLQMPFSLEFLRYVEALAASRLAAYRVVAGHVERLLDRVQPRLILVEGGCYGHNAVLNTVAHRRGIRVAELQHGMITRGHDVYNVALAMAVDPGYRRSQPDTLLTYGDWWSAQITAPVGTKVTIGDPRRKLPPLVDRQASRRVVVVGDGIETDWYVDQTRRLQGAAGSTWHVVFRPHPLERRRLGGRQHPVELDTEPDVARSLANAHAVLAEASTVMFEAIGVTPLVIALDTAKSRFYLGEHPFPRLGEAQDVLQLLERPPAEVVAEAFWADGWRERFRAFVAAAIP